MEQNFIPARKLFEEIVSWLNSDLVCGLDHSQLENKLFITGVIEGACRHLIKDRMDITDARWSLKGAEAVLRLRCVCVSGDWTDYWQFHIKQEYQRNHRRWYQNGILLLKSVSQACCSINFTPKQMVI